MNAPKTLSLVIPCYNEEATLAACLKRVLDIATDDLNLELVIVDDCSRDKSFSVAKELARRHPEITVVRQERNRGKGTTLRKGIALATGDFVGVQDADLEYDPQDFHIILQPIYLEWDRGRCIRLTLFETGHPPRVVFFAHVDE
jgi:glycosyltransferase involved in cell wall biosynthesis